MSLFALAPLVFVGKMILIAGVLYGYYRLFLRNAVFHSYNRWYLLGSAGLALVLPWMRFPFPGRLPAGEVFAVLAPAGMDAGGVPAVVPAGSAGESGWWAVGSLYVLYGIGAAVFAWFLLRSLYYLYKLSRQYPSTLRQGVRFFETGEPGTPFSFLNRLFWNRELEVDSEAGRSIFRHEVYHIRQRHTLDLLALEVLRCLFWVNPFFHLILRELKVVHEFLADRYALAGGTEAVSGGDVADGTGADKPGGLRNRQQYAEFLVWRSVRGVHTPAIAHPFFHTPLKRRITMILQTTSGRPRLVSRWMALPLLLALVVLTAGTSAGPGKPASHKQLSFNSVPPLIRYYMKHIQYPSTTLKAGQEATLSFTVQVGENHRLLAFDARPGAAPKDADVKEIVVTSRPSAEGKTRLTTDQAMAVFTEEVTRVSERLSRQDTAASAAYMAAIQPGTYHFRIVFKIEKNGTAAAGGESGPIDIVTKQDMQASEIPPIRKN